MKRLLLLLTVLESAYSIVLAQPAYRMERLHTESLDRGLVAMRQTRDSLSVSWRMLREDPDNICFDLYMDEKCMVKDTRYTFLNLGVANIDFSKAHTFRVTAHSSSRHSHFPQEATYVLPANAPLGYLDIALDKPEDQWLDLYTSYTYNANDASVADVDGDGQLELVLKWEPSNAHDNSHNGYTGNVYLDCYEITGQESGVAGHRYKWRIDLGPNIRAGAHYTQPMVYDLDGDGKAEVVMKTADGTIDGEGDVIGNPAAFWVNANGHILDGPEYLTVFSGETGKALYTTDYVPGRGEPGLWGDNKGNRSERYLACVGYLGNVSADGKELASVIMCRGYYTRATLAAWDWNGKELRQRWFFDSYADGQGAYSSQGNHNLRVADVDADGYDEIVYGSCTIDHNGTGLYSTGLGHGDAMHLTAFLPDDKHLQVWQCHESHGRGSSFRDARTGKIIFQIPYDEDCGRCMAADIDPTSEGVEMWSLCTGGIRNTRGEKIANPRGLSYNMAVWWDGDLLRELLDRNSVTKYDWTKKSIRTVTTFLGVSSNNSSKSNPCLQADVLGDWREEVLMRSTDSEHVYLFMTPYPTDYRFDTFLQDIPYRLSVVTENVAYNQPTQPGFYFGPDMKISNRNKCKQ